MPEMPRTPRGSILRPCPDKQLEFNNIEALVIAYTIRGGFLIILTEIVVM